MGDRGSRLWPRRTGRDSATVVRAVRARGRCARPRERRFWAWARDCATGGALARWGGLGQERAGWGVVCDHCSAGDGLAFVTPAVYFSSGHGMGNPAGLPVNDGAWEIV